MGVGRWVRPRVVAMSTMQTLFWESCKQTQLSFCLFWAMATNTFLMSLLFGLFFTPRFTTNATWVTADQSNPLEFCGNCHLWKCDIFVFSDSRFWLLTTRNETFFSLLIVTMEVSIFLHDVNKTMNNEKGKKNNNEATYVARTHARTHVFYNAHEAFFPLNIKCKCREIKHDRCREKQEVHRCHWNTDTRSLLLRPCTCVARNVFVFFFFLGQTDQQEYK